MERALFVPFFTIRSYQQCKKSVQKEKLQSTERNVCARHNCFELNYSANFPNNSHSKEDPRPLRQQSMEVFKEGVRSKLISRVFLFFDINIKERRNSMNEVP